MFKLTKAVALATFVSGLATSGYAATALVVDDFTTFLEATTTVASPSGVISSNDSGASGAIGDRVFSVEKTEGAANFAAATTSTGSGLSLSSAGSVKAIHRITYGSATALEQNLTTFVSLLFAVDFLDVVPVTFSATLTDGLGTVESKQITLSQTAPTPSTYVGQFSLSNFVTVNLADIDVIDFKFDALAGADLVVRNIEFAPVPEVSATGSLAAIASLLAMMAFLWERRRTSLGTSPNGYSAA